MNKSETLKVLSIIQEAYPHFMERRTPDMTAEIWARAFSREPYEIVNAAVFAFISSDTRGFPPYVGIIKEKIAQMTDTEPDELQAWSIVNRALCRATRKEFSKLPSLIQQCIGSPETFIEWANMDIGAVNSVIAAAFMRTYRVRAEKQREYGKLPSFAKSSYTAISPIEPYKLPPPKPEREWSGEAVPVPACVMDKVAELRKSIPANEIEGSLQEKAHALMQTMVKGLQPKTD